jgi:hypothetical protein
MRRSHWPVAILDTGAVGAEYAFSRISWTALTLEVGKSPTEDRGATGSHSLRRRALADPRTVRFSTTGANMVMRGCGEGWASRYAYEPPLRSLYNVLASSSIGHHQFREEASTRSARIFVAAVSTSDLPNEAEFFSPPAPPRR